MSSADERRVMAAIWLNSATIAARSGGMFNCIGVVAVQTFQDEWKAYWGAGIGISERSDAQHIAAYGDSLTPEQAHGFFPHLDIMKYKDGPGQAAGHRHHYDTKLAKEAIDTIYQMASHFKNGEIEPERLFHLGGFLAYHRRLEIAAHETLKQLTWLNGIGRFTSDEWAILSGSLQEALAEEAQTIHPVVVKGEPALTMQEAAVYLAMSERDFYKSLRDLHERHKAGTVDRDIQRHKQEGKREIYIHISDLDWMKEQKRRDALAEITHLAEDAGLYD